MEAARDLPLLAAWRLRAPARVLRALAGGDSERMRAWLRSESALRLAEARRDARADFAVLEQLGARLVLPADSEWPTGFCALADPPAFVAVRGALPSGGVAVVGTRDADAAARAFAAAFARALRRTVVSGLARGVDTAAHRGALEAGSPTVAYVGTGLARTSPPENEALANAIVVAGGAVVAERPPHDVATRWSLMRRDRLQAAHAHAVVLVASERTGGALHTLRFAQELHRPRFALDRGDEGNRAALAAGAVRLSNDPVEAAAEVVRHLSKEPSW